MMVGLLDCPEEISFKSALNPATKTCIDFSYAFDEELLRWIAEAEYLGVSKETAILIATKRRALSMNKSSMNMTDVYENKDDISSIASLSKVNDMPIEYGISRTDFIKVDPKTKNYDKNASACEYLCSDPKIEEIHAIKNCSTQASSTQETIITRVDIERSSSRNIKVNLPLDQVIDSTIAVACSEEYRKKKKKKGRKRNFQKGSLLSVYSTNQGDVQLGNSSTNAILLSNIVEKDLNDKQASDDNNSSVDTTMGIVNSGLDQVDSIANNSSSLDAIVTSHNNPFNNHLKVGKKRSNKNTNYNLNSNSNRIKHLEEQVGCNSNDFTEPSKINVKNAKRNFNRHRRKSPLLLLPSNRSLGSAAPGFVEPRRPQNIGNRSNRYNFNNSDKGCTKPRKSEAVEHVREQLRIAYKSRGILEL